MIWTPKEKKEKPIKKKVWPKVGDRRTVKAFAFIPTRLADGRMCWLEPLWEHQIFQLVWNNTGHWVTDCYTLR